MQRGVLEGGGSMKLCPEGRCLDLMPHLMAAEVGSSEQMAELRSPLWAGPRVGKGKDTNAGQKFPASLCLSNVLA